MKSTRITVPCSGVARTEFADHAKKKGRLFTAWCLEALVEKLKREQEISEWKQFPELEHGQPE